MNSKFIFSIFLLLINLNSFAGERDVLQENEDPGFDVDRYNFFDDNLPAIKFYHKEEGNFYLSNFYPVELSVFGYKYPSSEHAYQSQKFKPESETFKEFFDAKNSSAEAAYRIGRKKTDLKYENKEDWDRAKDKVMYDVVWAKFSQNQDIKKMLLETGRQQLIEWTKPTRSGSDSFWGISRVNGQGKNHLGKILMTIRAQFKGEMDPSAVEEILEGLKGDVAKNEGKHFLFKE